MMNERGCRSIDTAIPARISRAARPNATRQTVTNDGNGSGSRGLRSAVNSPPAAESSPRLKSARAGRSRPLPQDEDRALRELDDPVFDRSEGELPQPARRGRADHQQRCLGALAQRLRFPLGRVDDLRLDGHAALVRAALEACALLFEALGFGRLAPTSRHWEVHRLLADRDQDDLVDLVPDPDHRTRGDPEVLAYPSESLKPANPVVHVPETNRLRREVSRDLDDVEQAQLRV